MTVEHGSAGSAVDRARDTGSAAVVTNTGSAGSAAVVTNTGSAGSARDRDGHRQREHGRRRSWLPTTADAHADVDAAMAPRSSSTAVDRQEDAGDAARCRAARCTIAFRLKGYEDLFLKDVALDSDAITKDAALKKAHTGGTGHGSAHTGTGKGSAKACDTCLERPD